MKNAVKTGLVLLVALCLLVLGGCGHTHTWEDATCKAPKTCSECGETEGTAVGHSWEEATCMTPKTCKTCGETEDEALGHTWNEATCAAPKRCIVCGETEGDSLGHTWVEATCTTPKTCDVCGETEGEALGHNAPDLTCVDDAICTRCGEMIAAPGHRLSDSSCTEAARCTVCGEVSGEPLGHTSESGVCERCGLEIYTTVSGKGDDVVSDITVGDGLYKVHFTHNGRRNFIVKAYDANNDWDLLVNEIGKYDGYVLLLGESPFAFEITANGEWAYTIEPLSKTPDAEFAGKGNYVTGLCTISSGAWEFTHDGDSNFAVWIYTTDGRDLLVNEIGSYTGKKLITIPDGSLAVFAINADGNWSIKKA